MSSLDITNAPKSLPGYVKRIRWLVGLVGALIVVSYGAMLVLPIVGFVPSPVWYANVKPFALAATPYVSFLLTYFMIKDGKRAAQYFATVQNKQNFRPLSKPKTIALFAFVWVILAIALSAVPHRLVPMAHAWLVSAPTELTLTVREIQIKDRKRASHVAFEDTHFLWGTLAMPESVLERMREGSKVQLRGTGSSAGLFPDAFAIND